MNKRQMKKLIYSDAAGFLEEHERSYLTLKRGVNSEKPIIYGDLRDMTPTERARWNRATDEVIAHLEKLAGYYDGWLEDKYNDH